MWAASWTTTIWLVMGEVDDPLVEIARGHGAGRAVGIVDDQQLGPLADVGGNAVQVGIEAVLFVQRQIVDLAAVIFGVRAGDGIAGHGHQGDVAGLMKQAGSMARAGLEPMAWLISVSGSSVTPKTFFMNSAAASLKAAMPLSA